eukprot:2098768-Rhodomonas_salina.1
MILSPGHAPELAAHWHLPGFQLPGAHGSRLLVRAGSGAGSARHSERDQRCLAACGAAPLTP